MNSIEQCYEILGLKPGASQAEVKQAYRNLAMTWHPDRFSNASQLKQKAEEKIKKINQAYQQLKSYQPNSPSQTSASKIYCNSLSAETFYNQGVEKVETGRYQEAIEDFTKAIRFNPNYIEAYKSRGFACSKLGYSNRANSDFKKAVELEFKQRKTKPSQTSPPPKSPSPTSGPPKPPSPASSPSILSWKCVRTLTGHSDLVATVAISRDGKTLISGSFDKTIKLWHLSTGQLIRTLTEHSDRVRCVAISPSGQILASGSADKTIKLWDLSTGKVLRTLGSRSSGHSNEVSVVAFSPDRLMLASGVLIRQSSCGRWVQARKSARLRVIQPRFCLLLSAPMEKF